MSLTQMLDAFVTIIPEGDWWRTWPVSMSWRWRRLCACAHTFVARSAGRAHRHAPSDFKAHETRR